MYNWDVPKTEQIIGRAIRNPNTHIKPKIHTICTNVPNYGPDKGIKCTQIANDNNITNPICNNCEFIDTSLKIIKNQITTDLPIDEIYETLMSCDCDIVDTIMKLTYHTVR